MAPLPAKTADNKGRLTLGQQYAEKQFFINRTADGIIQLIPAETIPAREVWLFKNREALAAVLEGLDQARQGELTDGPDLDAFGSLADEDEG